ncbi:MAG: enoyl-CoA hydratase-related protein [Longimicrobiales bacterium]
MSYERIRAESSAAVAVITLNRPEKRNALDATTVRELKEALCAAQENADIRVILLRGEGKDFCAGADLAQLERIAAGASPLENLEDAMAIGNLFIEMRRSDKPIIAAVQGNAIAGGAGLATACDIVLAAESAVFGYPEVHLGFVPAMVMALLRRSVGEKRAFDLVVRGDLISAAEAFDLGIVTRVVADAALAEAAHDYAAAIAARPSSAVRLTKRLLYGIDGLSFEEAIARGAEVNALARFTDECRDGVRRFLDKQRDR